MPEQSPLLPPHSQLLPAAATRCRFAREDSLEDTGDDSMIFFCRKTSTADGRTRWSVCVPTLMGFTTIAWFYSEALADNFIRHLESNEEDRQLASLDACSVWTSSGAKNSSRTGLYWKTTGRISRRSWKRIISASTTFCVIRPAITARPLRPSGMKASRSWALSPDWKSWPRPCISKAASSTPSRRRSLPGSSGSCPQRHSV